MKNKVCITIGPAMSGKGGVVTVLQNLEKVGFFQETNTLFIPSSRQSKFMPRLIQFAQFVTCILRVIKNCMFGGIGLAHIHVASKGSYFRKSIIIRIFRYFNVPVIIHLHGAKFDSFYNNAGSWLKRHINETFNMAAVVVVLSASWKRWVDETFQINSVVVYNFVQTLDIKNTTSEIPVILFLGRLGQRKGVDDLLNSFVHIVNKYPSARLVLGGDGDLVFYDKMIRELNLQANVELAGWVSGDKKLELLAKASIYVLPSYAEGLPMGLLEAMSSGVPVIASNVGGIPDAITHNHNGLLINAGEIENLTNCLEELLSDPIKRANLAAEARQCYLDAFCPEVVVPQLISIYQNILSERNGYEVKDIDK